MTPAGLGTRAAAARSPRPTLTETAQAAAATLALLGLVAGVPVALWALGRALHPTAGMDLSRAGGLLLRPDDGTLLILALLTVGWVTWAVFAFSVAVEVLAVARGVPTPRLPLLGLSQHGAAALVATAGLLLVPNSPPLPMTPRAHAVSFSAPLTGRPTATEPAAEEPATAQPVARAPSQAPPPASSHPTVTVQRHDTLWGLAERHLGSGHRYREIVDLNLGRPQPDGRTLTEAHWIYPGWVLPLPPDATVAATPTADGTPAAPATSSYTVEAGDSLWAVAEEQLGDGHRYPEIYALNVGREQPDGRQLLDPDEIHPGWRLRLPTAPVITEPPPKQTSPRRTWPPPTALSPESSLPMPTTSPDHARTPGATPPTGSQRRGPDSEVAVDHDASAVPTLVLGLASIALTGLVAELTRRRRLQQRSRRTGRRVPLPKPEAAASEAQARAAADAVTVDTVASALRALAASCRAADRPIPDVALLRLTPSSIELTLTADDSGVVPPFRSAGPRTWHLDAMPPGSTDDGETEPDPYPALVTLGVADDALVLLNLEAAGALEVAGPAQSSDLVLRALAVELTVGPLSQGSTVTFVDCFHDLAHVTGAGRARVAPDGPVAARETEARLSAVHDILTASGAADLRDARAGSLASDASTPEIIVSLGTPPTTTPPWSGAAVVASVETPTVGSWTLMLRPDGSATLQPFGISLLPQHLDPDAYQRLVSLLRDAGPVDHGPAATTPTALAEQPTPGSTDDGGAALAALPELPPPADVAIPPRVVAPRVLMLGPVHVEGADDENAPGRRRRATEFVAYLALHPGATANQIDEAMWPGRRVAKTTRNPFISRVRQWLGRTPDGQPYLPLVADGGRYRLAAEVTCDWHDFVRLARGSLAGGSDGADDLDEALQLVRGRPFLGVDPATYTWAEADMQEMISAIVDVAHVLSVARFDAGDYRGAQQAASKGLLVEPCSELLYRDAIRAAATRGDHQEAERLAERLRAEVARLDPDDGVDDETAELISSFKRAWS